MYRILVKQESGFQFYKTPKIETLEDLKNQVENLLEVYPKSSIIPVKICDFDVDIIVAADQLNEDDIQTDEDEV